jgi:tetratricopeptide (TPR) repeat protein
MTTAAELRDRALAQLERGDTANAIADLREYLAQEEEDAGAWLALGTAYLSIDHVAQAVDALREAVDQDGSDVDARLSLARALVVAKKLDDAAFQLVQASKLAPTDARVLRDLGLVFYDKRLFEKAALWLGRAVEASPKDARLRFSLGLAHEGRRDTAAAIASYRDAVRLDRELVDARRTLADALASIGEHEEAIAELEAVLRLDRTNEAVAHNFEVLHRALAEMRAQRLLGKAREAVTKSALVTEGQLRDKSSGTARRWVGPMLELYATEDEAGVTQSMTLVITDPTRAAKASDDTFKVNVVGDDGARRAVNFATAASLTFLREALGCPMTKASELYATLLAGGEGSSATWGGVTLTFVAIAETKPPRFGLRASL